MEAGFLKVPWLVWGILALVVAGVFAVFVPNAARVNTATGMAFIIARWFHSLTWVLLALSFFLRGTRLEGLANPVAMAGGLAYLIFIVVFSRL